MSTIVLRLIGDEWKYEEKIAISVPAQAALKMSTAIFAKRLQVPSWSGLTLYYSEGKYPNKIRPTIPISLETNPQREKFTNGTVLWVKVQADKTEQEADRRFHESLLIWRKENNIPGILSDGSDVSDFLYEYLSHLNAEDTRDITGHESEKRAIVEGEEHRSFWTLTFEYHEIQNMKDEEQLKRQQLWEEWSDGTLEIFKLTVRNPLAALRRREASESEEADRRAITSESTTEYNQLVSGFHTVREQLIEAARLAENSKAAALVTTVQPPSLSSRAVASPSVAPSGGAIFAGDVSAIVAAITSSMEATREKSIEDARRATEQLEMKLLSVVREVRQESAELRGALQQVLKDHQIVSQSIQENAKLSSERLHEDRLELIDAQLSSVARELGKVSHSTEASWGASGSAEIEEGVKLLEEQRDLLQNMIAAVSKEAAEKEAMEHAVEAAAMRHVVRSALESQALLNDTVHKLESEMATVAEHSEAIRRANIDLMEALHREATRSVERERSLLEAAEKIANLEGQALATSRTKLSVAGRFGRDSLARSATLGLHPDVFQVIFMLLEQRLPLPRQFIEEAGVKLPESGDLSELDTDVLLWLDGALHKMPEVHDYLREYVVDIVLEYGSSHQICDELCRRFGIMSHPYRKLFSRHVEHFAPHMHAAVDVLLHLFQGREVELFSEIAGLPLAGSCITHLDLQTGKSYYSSSLVAGVTQWLQPYDL